MGLPPPVPLLLPPATFQKATVCPAQFLQMRSTEVPACSPDTSPRCTPVLSLAGIAQCVGALGSPFCSTFVPPCSVWGAQVPNSGFWVLFLRPLKLDTYVFYVLERPVSLPPKSPYPKHGGGLLGQLSSAKAGTSTPHSASDCCWCHYCVAFK